MTLRLPVRRGFAFWPFIVIPSRLKGLDAEACITHERVHHRRQRWLTPFWVLWYFLNRRFRWAEEQLAYKAEIEYRRARELVVDMEYYIRALSRSYWGMCTEEEARTFMNSLSSCPRP